MSKGRVLHVLSQRPSLTGSGVTLEALVRCAADQGWEQVVVAGLPVGEPVPEVGGLPTARVRPLTFGGPKADVSFAVPGMSDVMPYRSTVFSAMTPEMLAKYREAWRGHLATVVEEFEPRVIHVHHAWLVAAAVAEVAGEIPVVIHGHGTGLRQLALCPHLADEVRAGLRRCERLVVLHREHAGRYARELGLDVDRIEVVGAGYREEIFHGRGRGSVDAPTLVYVGKYSHAKGLPWLLDAVERLANQWPGLTLQVAGSGAGEEAELLRVRMADMPCVVMHGQIDQLALAELLRRAQVFVLPSFSEGLPLVLVEALACGCWAVCTDLPGVADELAGLLGESLIRVPLPRLHDVDVPHPEDLPAFIDDLAAALARGLALFDERGPALADLSAFTWAEVFARVERVWLRLGRERPS